jgi:MFS family permease
LGNFFNAGVGVWITTFMVRYHHMSIATASSAVALLALGSIAGILSGGVVGDRLMQRGYEMGRLYIAGGMPVLGVILAVPAFAISNTALMLVLLTVAAVALNMPTGPLAAMRADVVHPDLRGRAASATALVSTATAAVSPLLFGVMSDAIGLRSAFLFTVPGIAVGGLLFLALGPRFLTSDIARMRRQLAGQEDAPAAGPGSE